MNYQLWLHSGINERLDQFSLTLIIGEKFFGVPLDANQETVGIVRFSSFHDTFRTFCDNSQIVPDIFHRLVMQ